MMCAAEVYDGVVETVFVREFIVDNLSTGADGFNIPLNIPVRPNTKLSVGEYRQKLDENFENLENLPVKLWIDTRPYHGKGLTKASIVSVKETSIHIGGEVNYSKSVKLPSTPEAGELIGKILTALEQV